MMTKENTMAVSGKNKFYYGWVIAIAAMFIYAIGSGQAVSFGIFIKPIAKEFNWTRASLNGVFGLYILSMSISAFIFGILVDRVGPRIICIAGGILLGLGLFLSSMVNELWQLYLSYSFLGGLGFSCMFVPLASTLPRWFIKKRGLALGIYFAGGGVGGLILTPFLQSMISNHGWRTAFVVLSIIATVVVITASLFLKKEPAEIGLKPLGFDDTPLPEKSEEENQSSSNADIKNYTIKDAVKSSSFWIFAVSVILLYIAVMMAQLNMVAHATDKGIADSTAALALGLVGGFNAIGRLVMGAVSDKIGTKKSFIICMIIIIASLLWLIIVNEPWMIFLFAIPFGFAYGGSVPQPTRGISELFGVKAMGSILGVFTSITAIGPALGPVLGGALFDRTGDYNFAFLIGALCVLISFVLVMFIKFDKKI